MDLVTSIPRIPLISFKAWPTLRSAVPEETRRRAKDLICNVYWPLRIILNVAGWVFLFSIIHFWSVLFAVVSRLHCFYRILQYWFKSLWAASIFPILPFNRAIASSASSLTPLTSFFKAAVAPRRWEASALAFIFIFLALPSVQQLPSTALNSSVAHCTT